MSVSFIWEFVFRSGKNISNIKIIKKADIGTPWPAPLSSRKYVVLFSPLMALDFWCFEKIFIQKNEVLTKFIFICNINQNCFDLAKQMPFQYPLQTRNLIDLIDYLILLYQLYLIQVFSFFANTSIFTISCFLRGD